MLPQLIGTFVVVWVLIYIFITLPKKEKARAQHERELQEKLDKLLEEKNNEPESRTQE
jgi:hypothetical protein